MHIDGLKRAISTFSCRFDVENSFILHRAATLHTHKYGQCNTHIGLFQMEIDMRAFECNTFHRKCRQFLKLAFN